MKNRDYGLFFVLLLSLVVRLLFFFEHHITWWDSAVYVGMGQYIFSLGKMGLWEPIRPLLWPIIMGALWKTGLSVVVAARVVELLLTLGSVLFLYLCAESVFNKRVAFISSILFSFSPVLFFSSFHLFTEIPTVFFTLLAFWLFLRKKHLFSGLTIGLAVMTKFPVAIFFFVFLVIYVLRFFKQGKQEIENTGWFILGFVIVTLPYFIFNQIKYNNPLLPLTLASTVIKNVVACTEQFLKPWYYYFTLLMHQSIFHVFALLSLLYFTYKLKKKNLDLNHLFIVLSFLLPFIYFFTLKCKTPRYMLLYLPFLAILAAKGLDLSIRKRGKFLRISVILLVLISSIWLSINYYQKTEIPASWVNSEFYGYLKDKSPGGEIISTTPLITLYVPAKIDIMYFPLYNTEKIREYRSKLEQPNKVSYVLLIGQIYLVQR